MADLIGSERTRLRRRPERGAYDRDTVHAVLDAGLVCHIGFVHDGQPFVLPAVYARVGESLYVHGSAASRMLRGLRDGLPVCVTVTLLDGIVLARSAFHHSMNYRSAVLLGVAVAVEDEGERLRAFEALIERMVRGRWTQVRPPNTTELRATMVLRLPIAEASAKIRSGPPLDDAEDLGWPCWAGRVPVRLVATTPVPDGEVGGPAPTPEAFALGAGVA
jgi:uncharacterized protein